MMRASRRLAGLSVVGLLSAGVVAVVPATAAHAAGTCWDAGFTAKDPLNNVHEVSYCNNVSPTTAYGWASYDWPAVGTLTSNPSWFVCKIDNGAPNGEVNGPHHNRWLWTQTDTGAWGWVSDNAVTSETDTVEYCTP